MCNAESILAFDRKGSSLHAHYILLGLVKIAVMLSHSFLLQRVRGCPEHQYTLSRSHNKMR